MKFTLQPAGIGVPADATNTNNTYTNSGNQTHEVSPPNSTSTTTTSKSMEKLTDGGKYKVNMSYSPVNIHLQILPHLI